MKSVLNCVFASFSFVLTVILFISCGSSNSDFNPHPVFTNKDFTKADTLKGVTKHFENAKRPSTIRIIAAKNLLIVNDPESGFLAKAYTLDSLKFIRSFVKKGEGPNEQLAIANFNYIPEENLIYAADLYKKTIYSYSIDSILTPAAEVWPVSYTSMRSGIVNRPVVLNKDMIIDFRPNRGNDSVAVFNFYNKKGELLSYKGEFPELENTFKTDNLITLFAGATNLTEDRSKIIVTYFYTDYIDLYDSLGNLLKRVHGPEGFDPEFIARDVDGISKLRATKTTKLGYRKSLQFHNNIFALFDGGLTSRDGYHANKLLQFNDTLAPVTRFILDTPIFDFDVDPKTGTMYGLTHESEGSIVAYKL